MRPLSVTVLLIACGAWSVSVGRAEEKTTASRKQVEAAWPGLGNRLEMDKDGKYSLNLCDCKQVADLTPLKGLPLTTLNLQSCGQVQDLAPLKGMPLTSLILKNCGKVQDLTPLKGMPLTTLELEGCGQIQDLSPLRGMPLTEVTVTPKNISKGMDVLREMKSLKTIGIGGDAKKKFAVEEFWKRYDTGEFK